jgi:RNA polymerase sigma-70 factor (ECF subfamily)
MLLLVSKHTAADMTAYEFHSPAQILRCAPSKHAVSSHSSFSNFRGAALSAWSSVRFAASPLREKILESLSSPGEISDEDLFRRLNEGHQEALGDLFDRYAQLVRGIAARILRNSAEAEDLVQDLFIFIQRKCGIFDSSKSTARSWIIQMAYHRSIERRRSLASRQFYAQTELESGANHMVGTLTGESDYSAEAVFGRNGLSKVLKSLTDNQRETLRLHLFDGYSLAEISQQSGQSLGNIRNHYYRGLDKLRKQMFGNNVAAEQRHEK